MPSTLNTALRALTCSLENIPFSCRLLGLLTVFAEGLHIKGKHLKLDELLLVSPEGQLLLTPEDLFGALQAEFTVEKGTRPTITAKTGDINIWLRVDSTIGSIYGLPLETSLEQPPLLWKRRIYVRWILW